MCASVANVDFACVSSDVLCERFCTHRYRNVNVNLQTFLLHIQRGSLYVFSVVQCCMTDIDTFLYVRVCFYLVEVSKVCVFASDHVEEDGNGGPP